MGKVKFVIGGKDHNFRIDGKLPDPVENFYTANTGHLDIEEEDVRLQVLYQGQAHPAAAGLADHLQVGPFPAQDKFYCFPLQGLVVDDYYCGHVTSPTLEGR